MAKQAKIEDIMIPIFDGINYSSWKLRLSTLLEYKECHEVIIKNEDEEAVSKRKDLKARTIIMSAITDKQLEYISECKTAYDMIKKFDKMYLTQSTAMQIICRGKIEEIRLNNYSTVEEFFVDFEKITNEFKVAGGKLDEQEKLRYLLRALPPSYSYIGDFLDVIPEEQRTVDYVCSKIKEKNMATSQSDNKNNMSTFAAKTIAQCFVCGKTGHLKKECWYRQGYTKGQQNFRGQRGLQRGYKRGGFFRGHSQGRGQNQFRNQNHFRSQNNFRGQNHFRGQGQSSGESSNNFSSESWTTEVCSNPKLNQIQGCTQTEECYNNSEVNWLLDSGCTDHIINNDTYFYNSIDLNSPINVKLPDGKMLKATKVGTVKIHFKNYYNEKRVDLKNVYFVEGIKQNLLSVSKITKSCTIVAKNKFAKIYSERRELIVVAEKINNLYCIKGYVTKNEMYAHSVNLTQKEKWHRALGHVNFQYLNKLVNNKLVDGLPDKIESTEMKCSNCIQSKMSNVPFKNNRTKTTEVLELIHTDLNGPHNTTGYGGEKYFLTFIDDYSKCTRIFCIKSKSEVANCFIEFVNLVENKFNKRVKKIQCDNGKEL